jgi:hypothetical protein
MKKKSYIIIVGLALVISITTFVLAGMNPKQEKVIKSIIINTK